MAFLLQGQTICVQGNIYQHLEKDMLLVIHVSNEIVKWLKRFVLCTEWIDVCYNALIKVMPHPSLMDSYSFTRDLTARTAPTLGTLIPCSTSLSCKFNAEQK